MHENLPLVSIIVLNYNGKKNLGKLLDACLTAVLNVDYPNFEVLFVDNGSTDSSLQYTKDRFGRNKRLQIIPLEENYGYAKGNNIAVKHANNRSKYLVFLNTDVKIGATWLKEMVNLMEEANKSGTQRIAAISSVIIDVSKKKIIDELWIKYPSGVYHIPLKCKSTLKEIIDIDFPSGEAFLIDRETFMKIGGFDEDYFLYMEDGDLGWRLRLIGYRIILNPHAKITHYRSLTVEKTLNNRDTFYLGERNRLVTCAKNLQGLSLIALIICETGRLISLLRRKELLVDYVRALFNIVTRANFRKILVKRRRIQSVRHISDRKIFERSIRRIPKSKYDLVEHALFECFA